MHKEEFYKVLADNGLLNHETLSELQHLTVKYPFFHAVWILYLKNLKITGHTDFKTTLEKAAIRIPDRKKLYEFLYSKVGNRLGNFYFGQTEIQSSSSYNEDSGQLHPGSNLIDKFLSGDHGAIKMDKPISEEHKEDNEIVDRSLAETDDLITETLAMIYFEQKKYDKAIDAFKKLSLKYPEKSVYFAARIEEIEKLKRFN